MATVEAVIDVDVPVSTAYDQWTRFDEFPRFMSGVLEVTHLDDTTTRWVAEAGGRRHAWNAEIVERHTDRVIAWRTLGPEHNHGRVTFSPSSDGTHISVELSWEADGASDVLGTAMWLDERQVTGDLKRFKELVERRAPKTAAWRDGRPELQR